MAQRVSIEPRRLLVAAFGVSGTVGGLWHAAERPVRETTVKGRYEMRRLLATALLAVSAVGSGVAADDAANRFHSPTAGLAFVKPAHWVFASVAALQTNRDNIRLADAELERLMKERGTPPLAAAMRYPEPHPDLNPSFQIGLRPLGALEGKSAREILELLLPGFLLMADDVRIVRPAEELSISGLPAARAGLEYTLRTVDGGAFPTRSDMVIVVRGRFMFMVGSGRKPDDAVAAGEIEEILASLVIDP